MKQLAVSAVHTHIVLDAYSSRESLSQLIAQTLLIGCAFSCLWCVCVCVCARASVCLILLTPTLSAGPSYASLTRSQNGRGREGVGWEEEDAEMKGGWETWAFDVKVWSQPKENFKHCIELKRLPPLHSFLQFGTCTHIDMHTELSVLNRSACPSAGYRKRRKAGEIEWELLSALWSISLLSLK